LIDISRVWVAMILDGNAMQLQWSVSRHKEEKSFIYYERDIRVGLQ